MDPKDIEREKPSNDPLTESRSIRRGPRWVRSPEVRPAERSARPWPGRWAAPVGVAVGAIAGGTTGRAVAGKATKDAGTGLKDRGGEDPDRNDG